MTADATPGEDPRIYVRVLAHLQGLIASGLLSQGEPTPTIGSLCHKFDCTRQTAAKALQMLTDDDILTRYPGVGYYVRVQRENSPVSCINPGRRVNR